MHQNVKFPKLSFSKVDFEANFVIVAGQSFLAYKAHNQGIQNCHLNFPIDNAKGVDQAKTEKFWHKKSINWGKNP